MGQNRQSTGGMVESGRREKLLELILASPNDARLKAYVSLARGGMDYQFFQLLTEKIDKASGEEKAKLEGIREKLLEFTNEIDKQLEARYKQAQEFVESLLAEDDVVDVVAGDTGAFAVLVSRYTAKYGRFAARMRGRFPAPNPMQSGYYRVPPQAGLTTGGAAGCQSVPRRAC
mgnify:CR=1 FL=1